MKVLQVIDALNVGGAERIVVNLSNLLYNTGLDISILLLVEDGELLQNVHPKIKIYRLERYQKFSIGKMKRTSSIIKKYDIVHVHLKHNYRYLKIVSLLFTKKKIILHDHSHLQHIRRSFVRKLKDSFFKNILKPDYYIGVSSEICLWAEKILQIKKNRIFKLTNIVTREDTTNIKNDKKECLVLVSNITRIKNISFALKIVKITGLNLTIYGKVYDKEYMDELIKERNQLDIQEKVKVISNVINIQKILPKYKFALHTSKKETGPLAVIEYLAQGIPFLSYDTGEVISTIKKDLPELIMNTFDEKRWADTIKKVIDTPKKKIETVYLKHFNPKNYTNQCLEIYKTVKNS
jgi:glycosyltransferase involved in cell wall biosynthesis